MIVFGMNETVLDLFLENFFQVFVFDYQIAHDLNDSNEMPERVPVFVAIGDGRVGGRQRICNARESIRLTLSSVFLSFFQVDDDPFEIFDVVFEEDLGEVKMIVK